ncbi:MAG: signal peptidase I [Armatimonadetes bacterium]|nr:signal peptidase I [Armatimonadota bacterium]
MRIEETTGEQDGLAPADGSSEPRPGRSKKFRSPKVRTLIYTGFGSFLLFLFAIVIFVYYNFKTIEVQGDSMMPTLEPGQRLPVSKAYWLVGALKPGDIVVIENSRDNEIIIKRVYKLAGEKVDLRNVPFSWDVTQGDYIVPEGTVYVLGDNWSVSQDSRHYGPFDLADVIGKVVVFKSALSSPDESGAL